MIIRTKRTRIKRAKMVGSSNPIRAKVANRYEITRTYVQTVFGIIVLTQDLL